MCSTDNSPKSIKSISNDIEELKSLVREQNVTIEELKTLAKQQNETIKNLNASVDVLTTRVENHEIKHNGRQLATSHPLPDKLA